MKKIFTLLTLIPLTAALFRPAMAAEIFNFRNLMCKTNDGQVGGFDKFSLTRENETYALAFNEEIHTLPVNLQGLIPEHHITIDFQDGMLIQTEYLSGQELRLESAIEIHDGILLQRGMGFVPTKQNPTIRDMIAEEYSLECIPEK